MYSIRDIFQHLLFCILKPGKERGRGGSTGSTGAAIGGGSMISFSMKSLMTRRKKSAPETEIKRPVTSASNKEDHHDDHYHHQPHHHHTRHQIDSTATEIQNTKVSLSPSTLTASYNVFLNDSCSVEVIATQQNSTVKNLLNQVC
jgi:hypothetical protein